MKIWSLSVLLVALVVCAVGAQAKGKGKNQFIIHVGPCPNCTVPGTLTLTPTFDSISVTATYTGDANANNSAQISYATGSGDPHQALTPFNDIRATVAEGNDNGANRYQFRGSIFGMTAGQTVTVTVTFADADGVSGPSSLSGTVTLLSSATVAQSGGTFYLDDVGSNGDGSVGSPFNTFANAFAATACGDHLMVQPGTYAAFTFSKTCSATTWYVIDGSNVTTTIVSDGSGSASNITIDGNYVQVKHLQTAASSDSAVEIAASRHDIWLDDLKVDDIATDAPGNCAAHYDDSAVKLDSANYRVFVLNSTLLAPTLASNCTLSPLNASPGEGISLGLPSPNGVIVLKGNTLTGGFKDCIGGSEGFVTTIKDVDIANNTISGCKDDAIQTDGQNINLRVWGNTITLSGSVGLSCFSAEIGYIGPQYWVRNYCSISTVPGDTGTGWKVGSAQAVYLFHNTLLTSGSIAHAGISGAGSYFTAKNNIWDTQGNCYFNIVPTVGAATDYNIYFRTGDVQLIGDWLTISGDYTEITGVGSFNAVTGQEAHGLHANPSLDGSLHISSSSPAYNVGVVINNINTSDSLWPAVGGRSPDMGAYIVP